MRASRIGVGCVVLAIAASCGGGAKPGPAPSSGSPKEVTIELTLVRTVEAPPEGIAPDASFVPYKEFVWKDWMHAGDCVLKNMNAKYYKNGVITFSADARSEDTGDCWNPFKLNSYNGANAHLHETHNHPYCMQEKSKDFPVRWDDSYPEAFFNELQRVSARGSC